MMHHQGSDMAPTFKPTIETLEDRFVPAAVTTNLTNGILAVVGTSAADQITIRQTGITFVVTATTTGGSRVVRSFTGVSSIVVSGESGNDRISIGPEIRLSARLYGGWGSDSLYGGSGNDQLYGGDQRDVLQGRAGNDALFGGGDPGDALDGGTGRNVVVQGSPSRGYTMNTSEREVIRLVNVERARFGLPALQANTLLANAAHLHSLNMARLRDLEHTLFGTSMPTPSSRLDYVGYTDARTWGENVAVGYTTAAAVVQAWMNSPGHRANILNANFTEIGVGMATASNGQLYWAQSFGDR
jgi:hypothetical protein